MAKVDPVGSGEATGGSLRGSGDRRPSSRRYEKESLMEPVTEITAGARSPGCPRCAAAAEPVGSSTAAPAGGHGSRRGWLQALAAVPGAVLPLLPSFTCPACLAAYGGVLSAMGVGFLLNGAILRPLILGVLVLGIASVGWSTRSHRRAGPLIVTVLASLAIVAGRLVWSAPVAVDLGAAAFLVGSLWNLWLKRRRRQTVTERTHPLNQGT